MDSSNRITVAVCGVGIKLTWAAPIAVAAIQVIDAHLPLYLFTFTFLRDH